MKNHKEVEETTRDKVSRRLKNSQKPEKKIKVQVNSKWQISPKRENKHFSMSSSFVILILSTSARKSLLSSMYNNWDEHNVPSWMLTFLFISQEHEQRSRPVKGNKVTQVCYNESYDNRKLLRLEKILGCPWERAEKASTEEFRRSFNKLSFS